MISEFDKWEKEGHEKATREMFSALLAENVPVEIIAKAAHENEEIVSLWISEGTGNREWYYQGNPEGEIHSMADLAAHSVRKGENDKKKEISIALSAMGIAADTIARAARISRSLVVLWISDDIGEIKDAIKEYGRADWADHRTGDIKASCLYYGGF